MKTIYTASSTHAQSSYGQSVLLDADGNPHGPSDVGLWDTLAPNMCGRVGLRDGNEPHGGHKPEWSGYSKLPDRMWRALCRMLQRTDCRTVTIYDAGRIVVS